MTFEEICFLFDMETVATQYGFKFNRTGHSRFSLCRLPSHVSTNRKRTPSFSIYQYKGRQKFRCHGTCGLSGDVIDLVGYMTIAGYNPKEFAQRKQAAENLRGGRIEMQPVTQKKHEVILLPDFLWKEFLPIHSDVRTYLHKRGFNDHEIEKWGFGSATKIDTERNRPIKNGSEKLLSIPIIHAGTTVGIKLRFIDAQKKYRYFSVAGSRAGLFNYDGVYGLFEPVLIAKGELCAALMARHFKACGLTSGENIMTDMEMFRTIRTALATSPKIYVSDNDAQGQKMGIQIAQRHDAVLKFPPEKYKDWDEWYLKEPEDCVGITQEWIEEVLR